MDHLHLSGIQFRTAADITEKLQKHTPRHLWTMQPDYIIN